MQATLRSPEVASIIDRLHVCAQAEDGPAKERIRGREEELGERLDQERRAEIYGLAPQAIRREVGELLYLLALSREVGTIVEFGTSHGLSTIYMAAALRDSGGRCLITTERLAGKAEIARRNIAEAGLDDLVELRVGDALETLENLNERVDLLFLDGRNDLYRQVLQSVEPQLAPSALVVADLSTDDPDLLPYLEYVRDPACGYFSVTLPLDTGVELSVRTALTA